MNTGTRYPYADGDLLETRAQYSFSRFEGPAFLQAWRRQRAAVAAPPGRTVAGAQATDRSPLLAELDRLAGGLRAGPPEPEALAVLRRLLQRFEVSKRLHGRYDASWRPVDPADYRPAERYVRFAELLDLAYERTRELPFLNGLLKCLDTVSSLAPSLDAAQLERVRTLLASEQAHVDRLARAGRVDR